MDVVDSGFLILDKPLGMTSRGAVDCCAQWFPRRARLGHTGTLDPLATGILVIAVGLGTRLTDYVQRMAKTYRAGIRLGARSDTDDAEGTIIAQEGAAPLERAAVDEALQTFVGAIAQVPPAYSAVKVEGRRAYALARRGAEVELTPRQVRIDAISLLRYEYPDLDVEVRCGKGTYIRALARDLGERLGCGAYVQSLRRTRVGPFDESAALTLDADRETARRALLDLSWALRDLPRVAIASAEAQRLARGQALPWTGIEPAGEVAVWDEHSQLIGVGRIDDERRLCPAKMLWQPDRP